MTVISPSKDEGKRHLTQLPVKSFVVAPGDVVGGLIYVMDKPLGIEEGMIGMSIDSPGYRDYVKNLILRLDNNRKINLHPPEERQLQEKYNSLIKNPNFNFATLEPATQNILIDLFLHHPNIAHYIEGLKGDEKAKVNAIKEEFLVINPKEPLHRKESVPLMENLRKLFSKRMHEMTTTRYVNVGMGGLLFANYKKECQIKDKEHFAAHIKKLMHANKPDPVNNVYMIKQDGKLGAFHGTGPGFSKILKTNTGKKLQENFTIPKVFTIVLPLWTLIRVTGQRIGYLIKNSPVDVNTDAIAETMATKLATNRGIEAQEIETLKGTYEDGSPKVTTLVTWTPGCRDFSGTEKVQGNSQKHKGLLVAQTKNGETIKIDKEGNLLHRKEIKVKEEVTGYQYFKNGIEVTDKDKLKVVTQAYTDGTMMAEDRVDGLGESLVTLIAQGDRDAIGKKGQNKAYVPTENGRFKFYGIDFGKAYKNDPNPLLATLSDDFSFKSPTGTGDVYFSNYTVLYDNPLRDKMKGIYLLAALRGELKDPRKAEIADEFANKEPKDLAFAQKLRAMPGESPEELIDAEIEKYRAEIKENPSKEKEYNVYIKKLEDIKRIAKETDDGILRIFSQRSQLLPSEIDALERMEKLTARNASITKKDKNVTIIRNHIHVKRKDRIAWQFENGRLTTTLTADDAPKIQTKFNKMISLLKEQKHLLEHSDPAQAKTLQEVINQLDSFTFVAGKNALPKLASDEHLAAFCQYVSEDKIAKVHDLKEYKDAAAKREFSAKRDAIDKLAAKDNPTVTQKETAKPAATLFEVVKANPQPVHQAQHAQTQERRKKPLTTREPAQVPPIPKLDQLAEQEVYSFETFDAYTKAKPDDVFRFHHINEIKPIKMGNFQQHDARVIFFEVPKGSGNHATVFAQTSTSGLKYSTPITEDLDKFRLAAQETCRLAVFASTPDKPIYMSPKLSDAKKEIMQKAFSDAVEEAIAKGKFKRENKPELLERDKPNMSRGPQNVAG